MDDAGVLIELTVGYKTNKYHIIVPELSTFLQIKEELSNLTGIAPQDQKLLFRGKEKPDDQQILYAGLRAGSTLSLVEADAYKEAVSESLAEQQKRLKLEKAEAFAAAKAKAKEEAEQAQARAEAARLEAADAVVQRQLASVGAAVDDLANQTVGLEQQGGTKRQAALLNELLTQKLLVLDGIKVTGDSRAQRKEQINRINSLCDRLEVLKGQLS